VGGDVEPSGTSWPSENCVSTSVREIEGEENFEARPTSMEDRFPEDVDNEVGVSSWKDDGVECVGCIADDWLTALPLDPSAIVIGDDDLISVP
jgi:hypothetical protein